MKFSLIICTYNRKNAIIELLESVEKQSRYPDEILVIDSSDNDDTLLLFKKRKFNHLKYFKVSQEHKGLTRQRNYGISKFGRDIDIVCFLDDDIVLEADYFEKLIASYDSYPDAIGIGGYIVNEVKWKKDNRDPKYDEYVKEGMSRKLGRRNLFRKRLGLLSKAPPGVMPEFSHGLSISFLPPSGKVYPVEFFMGGVSSYRKSIFNKVRFSNYFDGYGLYEDMDFCLRISKSGQLYVNTGARVVHNHALSGRPNRFTYGKMVVRNGWYVWRQKYAKPKFLAKIKWYLVSLLLALIRFSNVVKPRQSKSAFTETMGRLFGLGTLIFKKPIHEGE